jgi:glycosyltransferase involved in cell wall biosynthesis
VPDLNFHALREQMSLSRRLLLRVAVGLSVRRVKRVITISEFSHRQIMSMYILRPEKVVVTHLATRSRANLSVEQENGRTLRQFGIAKPYMVAFTSLSPHKNIDRLIDAFVLAQKKYNLQHHLVLIGHAPPGWPAKYMPPEVHATGRIEDLVVTSILKQAEMLVFPSVYEGFGLPVLEAMDVGTPVVCARAASLPEVTGQAALLFDPLRVEDIAEKIATVASDPKLREELRQKGFENIHTRFSWDKTAEETMQVYREVAATGGS